MKHPQHRRVTCLNPPLRDQTEQSLRPSERELVRRMRQIGSGSIEGLHVRDGQPLFTPSPSEIRNIKLGNTDQRARPRAVGDDARLKKHHRNLFDEFQQLQDGTIVTIKVQDGLPINLSVTKESLN